MNKKRVSHANAKGNSLSLDEKTAATYSPTGVQYHRRGRA